MMAGGNEWINFVNDKTIPGKAIAEYFADPIGVKEDDESDFVKILTKPKNALIVQYVALLSSEGVKLVFLKDDEEKHYPFFKSSRR